MCSRSACLRFLSSNCVGLLFFAVVAPLICVAYTRLPLSVFLSSLCTACLHLRAPYSHTVARAFARIIVSSAKPRQLQASTCGNDGQQQRCFVVRPTPIACIAQPNQLWLQSMLSWAAVLLSVAQWKKPLNVVAELPSICNAPGVRLLFQICGFYDYRSESAEGLMLRGHSLLLFDDYIAAMQAKKHNVEVEVVMIQ